MMTIILPLILIALVVVLAVLGLLIFLSYIKSHRLRVRDPMTRSHYIDDLWMMEYQDRDTKEIRWKSVWFMRKYDIEKPPAEAIDVGKKGRKYAECYRIAEGQHCWITDAGIKVQQITTKAGVKEWHIVDITKDGTTRTIDTFKPFTVTQRQEIINQHRKAVEISKQKGWNADKVMALAQVGILGLVIIMFLIFGKDVYEGHNQAQGYITQNLRIQEDISKNLAVLSQNLGVKLDNRTVQVSQVIQSQPPDNIIIGSDEEQPK